MSAKQILMLNQGETNKSLVKPRLCLEDAGGPYDPLLYPHPRLLDQVRQLLHNAHYLVVELRQQLVGHTGRVTWGELSYCATQAQP